MASSFPLLLLLTTFTMLAVATKTQARFTGTISPTPSGLYFVQANVGNPAYLFLLALDTVSASPFTWLQSAECNVSLPLAFPFDPKNSTTFKHLFSTAPICAPPISFPSPKGCLYDVVGTTKGFMGFDQFFSWPATIPSSLYSVLGSATVPTEFDTGVGTPDFRRWPEQSRGRMVVVRWFR